MIAGCAMNWFGRVLLLVLLVIAGAASWAFFDGDGWWRPGSEPEVAETAPDSQTQPQLDEHDSSEAAEAADPERPAFDIVRVEDTGEAVIAGVAPPGWTVRVETPDRLIGKVKAGFDGSWVLLPDAPLPAGDHSLRVSAQAPDGSQTIRGTQRVAISVSPETAPAMVALSQDSQPTRILQSGQTAAVTESIPSASQQPVAFSAVDYEDEQAAGRLYLSGTAAPGARIALYLDNRFIGSTKTDVNGSWAFSITDILDAGQHQLRADHVDLDGGDVLSRAEVRFNPDAVAVASVQGGEVRMARGGQAESIGQEQRLSKPLGEELATQTEAASVAAIETEERRKEAIVVKRGDTLWHIAEEHYGSGVRYTKIFRNNRDQIRNPHRIYPGQEFNLPQ
jgi:nucleoid-associated protein YgaU